MAGEVKGPRSPRVHLLVDRVPGDQLRTPAAFEITEPIMQRALNVTRERFADWYQAVVRDADMAETSPVRGAMVIKPWGYGRVGADPAGAGPPHQGDRP